jgi:hypothetical protein
MLDHDRIHDSVNGGGAQKWTDVTSFIRHRSAFDYLVGKTIMQQQLQILKAYPRQAADADSTTIWLLGAICVIGFAVALYIAVASGAPGFSDFASMSVFP